ncbi:MAG TPA: hypothetical protein VFH46_16045 [Pyrinomonadaceae bacterium]|nr:hypothetical protein [Pyrinomonadaceae bacterium]
MFRCFLVASADEVNNLDSIVLLENSTAPRAATHHLAIKFNRDPRGRKLKLVD